MAYATPLAAYLDQRTANEKESLGNIQQAGALQQLLAQAGAQQREAKAREIIASNATPEEKFNALSQVSPQHAHQFASGLKEMAAMKAQQGLQGVDINALLDNPQAALAAQAANPHIGPELERLRKVRENNAARATMQSAPAIAPDPQENAQAADQGTPTVATIPAKAGVFDSLSKSEVPAIANQAKNLQMQLNSPGNAAVPASHWIDLQKALAAQEAKVIETRSAAANRAPFSDIGKLRADLAAGRITKAEFDAAVGKKTGTTESNLTPDAIGEAAARYRIDGTLPPNLGRGGQGATNTALILNRAAALAKESGDTAEESRLRQIANRATSAALADLTKREGQIGAFEKTFVSNTQLVEKLSAAVDRDTNMPLVDRWIQSGKKATGPNPELRSLDTAIKGAVNEYTKIVSGTMGNTALAEGEIKKIEGLLSSAQTKEDVLAVIKTMRVETQNRMRGFKDQKAELIGNMRGTPSPAAAEPPPVTPPPVPASLTPAEQKELETLRKRFGR